MPARTTKKWQVTCAPERFIALRGQPNFQQLVALARWANAYRSVQVSIPKKAKQTPASSRQQINSLLLIAALLYEGWPLVKRMGQHFRKYPSWKKGFEPILTDHLFSRLIEQRLSLVRNQTVFHFHEDEVALRLAEHEPEGPVIFTSSRGKKSHQASYDLADLIAIRTMCGGSLTEAADILTQIAKLGPAFIAAADALIAEVLPEMGFEEHPA